MSLIDVTLRRLAAGLANNQPAITRQRLSGVGGVTMHLAGVPLRDARLVDDDALGSRLEDAYGPEVTVLALSFSERDAILAALEDPPAEFAELRGVLLREFEWRHAEGI